MKQVRAVSQTHVHFLIPETGESTTPDSDSRSLCETGESSMPDSASRSLCERGESSKPDSSFTFSL